MGMNSGLVKSTLYSDFIDFFYNSARTDDLMHFRSIFVLIPQSSFLKNDLLASMTYVSQYYL